MYTIIVNSNNELVTTVKERIMKRSKLVDSLHFLVDPIYKELDMSDFTVMMEYILPISKEYHSEILEKSEELYKEKLEYKLPFDTSLTKEEGQIEIQLTFTKVDVIQDGVNKDTSTDDSVDTEIEGQDVSDVEYKTVQYVRKTSPTTITIESIATWSDIVPDEALNALDQRLIKMDAQIKALSETGNAENATKADNIVLDSETQELYLTSDGVQIGDKINLSDLGDDIVESNPEGLVTMMI